MGRRRISLLIALVAGCGASTPAICTQPPACPWQDLIARSQCGGDDGSIAYHASTADEQTQERALFGALLVTRDRAAIEALIPKARAIGLRLFVCGDSAVIVEDDAARRGRGAYVIALGDAAEILVQVPHSFSDLDTLPLGRELRDTLHPRALAVSTLHRRGMAGYGDSDTRVPPTGHADVAHDPDSTFQSFTAAWLATYADRLVVQLHGFADRRVDADLVVSSGAKAPAPPWTRAVRDQLRRLLPGRTIAAYPDDVDDLGATTNAQGRAIRAAGGRFLHVEMSASLRESLRRRKSDRGRFIAGLARALAAINGPTSSSASRAGS